MQSRVREPQQLQLRPRSRRPQALCKAGAGLQEASGGQPWNPVVLAAVAEAQSGELEPRVGGQGLQ